MAYKVLTKDDDTGVLAYRTVGDAGALDAAAAGGLEVTDGELALKSTVAGRGLTLTTGVLSVAMNGAGLPVAITTVGDGTLTAAAIKSGVILRSGPVGAYEDTTCTATELLAVMDNPAVGDSFDFYHVNGVAQTCTFTGGVGITEAGVVNNAASKVRLYRCTVTDVGTPAVTITGIGELVA